MKDKELKSKPNQNQIKTKSKTKIFSFFQFLNVKTAKDKLTQDNLYEFVLKKEYKKNQEVVFWSTFISYMVFYFTRKQWTVFGSSMVENETITNSQYAMIGLIFSVAYGISKFLSSPLSDTKSNRWLLGLGLIGAGIGNLLFGLSWISVAHIITPIILSCVLMIILGYIHSFGATPSTRFFYNWFPHKQRRNRIISWNVAHNIGSALATFIIIGSYSLFGDAIGRVGYFILPSAISIVIGVLVILIIKDNPESVGLPPIKEYYHLEMIGEKKKTSQDVNEANKPWSYFFVKYVLKNKYIWLLAISNLLIYTLRMGISDWSLLYFKEVHNFDVSKQGKWIYSMFDWGGLLFTLVIGLTANKYLKRFVPITIIVICVTTLALLGLWLTGSTQNIAPIAIFMLIAGMIFIPQCFLPIMVSEFSHYRVISTASGVLGIAGYVGEAIMSKVIIGIVLQNSWNGRFIFLIVCGFLAAAVLIPMFNKRVSQ